MSIEEFFSLITDSGALRYEVGHGNSEIGCQFNLSMMTYVDEIDNNKHIQMFYYEFLEAISRVAHKIKIFPNIDKYQQKNLDTKKKSIVRQGTLLRKATLKKLKSQDSIYSEYSSSSEESLNGISMYEQDKEDISHIINVEGKPLHIKLNIFIKLAEFTIIKRRNFYEIYED